jgi:hypothetical protein
MVNLFNDKCVAYIHPLGAELQSLKSTETGLEYMWEGNAPIGANFHRYCFQLWAA